MKNKILFVTSMRFGDSLQVLPIASWIHKNLNIKVDWAYHKTDYINCLRDILVWQPCINAIREYDYNKVTPWRGVNFSGAWRPWCYIGSEMNELCNNYYEKVFCFGYSKEQYQSRQIKFFSEHFAEGYNLGVDYGFKLNYGEVNKKYHDQVVKIDKMYQPVLNDVNGVNLSEDVSIIENLQLAAGAREVVTTRTGAAIALSLARIPFKIKFIDDDWDWYEQLCHKITGGVQRIKNESV